MEEKIWAASKNFLCFIVSTILTEMPKLPFSCAARPKKIGLYAPFGTTKRRWAALGLDWRKILKKQWKCSHCYCKVRNDVIN